jgi:hypothetical protein
MPVLSCGILIWMFAQHTYRQARSGAVCKGNSPGMIGGMSAILAVTVSLCCAQGHRGAEMSWTTYEAEAMKSTGTVLGPKYGPHLVETESSGQQCVRLAEAGQYVAFTAQSAANAMIVRYSLPDAVEGGGTRATLALYRNGERIQELAITSQDS